MDSSFFSNPGVIVLFVVLAVWSSVWKGFALWRAANDRSVPWFVVLFLLNTVGILEIIYLFAVSPNRKSKRQP